VRWRFPQTVGLEVTFGLQFPSLKLLFPRAPGCSAPVLGWPLLQYTTTYQWWNFLPYPFFALCKTFHRFSPEWPRVLEACSSLLCERAPSSALFSQTSLSPPRFSFLEINIPVPQGREVGPPNPEIHYPSSGLWRLPLSLFFETFFD